MSTPDNKAIRHILLTTYQNDGIWRETNPATPLPAGLERGSDPHLAFLTLGYTLSGGREPVSFWQAARTTLEQDAELFDPQFLAYVAPKNIRERLQVYGLTRKKSDVTVFQRIGQALVMRAKGSVSRLLADYEYDARQLLAMLGDNKATFPMLSGLQTAPRWLYGLATAGAQPLIGADRLPVLLSPAGKLALQNLGIKGERVTTAVFDPLTALGRHGCRQRAAEQAQCPVAVDCPVARFCRYGPEYRVE